MRGWFVALEFETHEHPVRMFLAATERLLAYEGLFLGLKVNREANTRLERIGLVIELVAGKDQPRFDAQNIEGFQTQRDHPQRMSGVPNCVPHREGVLRVTPHLVTQFAGVTSP